MNKEEYLEKMTHLGLSETESKIYMALLAKRELSAREIHELTGVPRTKVYEITQKMVLRGICISKKVGRKTKYQAVEPKRVFNKLIEEHKQEIKKKENLAKALEKALTPLYHQGMKNVDISDYVEVINDLSSIHERYVSLVKNTKFELLAFVRPPYAYQGRREKLEEQENAEFEILKRNVNVKVLYEYTSEKDLKSLLEHINKCVSAGEKARIIEKLPVKMYVFDRKYVLMALENKKAKKTNLIMLVIEHSGLGKAASMLFEYLWKKAKDYKVLESLIKKKQK